MFTWYFVSQEGRFYVLTIVEYLPNNAPRGELTDRTGKNGLLRNEVVLMNAKDVKKEIDAWIRLREGHDYEVVAL